MNPGGDVVEYEIANNTSCIVEPGSACEISLKKDKIEFINLPWQLNRSDINSEIWLIRLASLR